MISSVCRQRTTRTKLKWRRRCSSIWMSTSISDSNRSSSTTTWVRLRLWASLMAAKPRWRSTSGPRTPPTVTSKTWSTKVQSKIRWFFSSTRFTSKARGVRASTKPSLVSSRPPMANVSTNLSSNAPAATTSSDHPPTIPKSWEFHTQATVTHFSSFCQMKESPSIPSSKSWTRINSRMRSGTWKTEVSFVCWYLTDRISIFCLFRGSRGSAKVQIWLVDCSQRHREIGKKFRSTWNQVVVISFIQFQLGIKEIFENSATFPLLARGGPTEGKLKVSNIIQKSGIVVDEKGTTAWAATEIELVNKFGGDTHEFVVDRPFLFYIEDDTTGAKLFTGRVNNPEY